MFAAFTQLCQLLTLPSVDSLSITCYEILSLHTDLIDMSNWAKKKVTYHSSMANEGLHGIIGLDKTQKFFCSLDHLVIAQKAKLPCHMHLVSC